MRGGVSVRLELEAKIKPEEGETLEQLRERAESAGYVVLEQKTDGLIVCRESGTALRITHGGDNC